MTERRELTRDELLVLLIEECGEVIQAATKCLRFGFDGHHIAEYGINHEVLAKEAGDLLAVIGALPLRHDLLEATRGAKIAKAERAKAMYGATLGDPQ